MTLRYYGLGQELKAGRHSEPDEEGAVSTHAIVVALLSALMVSLTLGMASTGWAFSFETHGRVEGDRAVVGPDGNFWFTTR